MINKFWNWKTCNKEMGQADNERVLTINGIIAEESWYDDEVTPQVFKDELNAGSGDITVWINSPGGDCVAAAQIFNMLTDYNGKVTVKIDGIAASAASVIAMAGDTVLMSPVSMMMIHNPTTIAFGDHTNMKKAIEMLESVKNSIINAYALKTNMPRKKLSSLMDEETWMDATKAIELGFADDMIQKRIESDDDKISNSMLFSHKVVNNALLNKLEEHYKKPETKPINGVSAKEIRNRLDIIKKYI